MNRNMMRVEISMPTPDPLKIKMLHPPPIPKKVIELYNNKVFIYLTESLKNKYETMKGDDTWSQVGRKAFKAYFEGSHTLQMPDIESYLREIVALVTHRPMPITKPRSKEDEAKWDEVRKQIKARTKVQKGEYEKIGKELVKEIKITHKKANYGLESVEIKEKEELSNQEIKEMVSKNKQSYLDFLSKSKQVKASFADCKWKQQIKEVIV